MVDPVKVALKSMCTILASPAHSHMHFAVYATRTKVHHRYPDLFDKQPGWLEAHHKSSDANRHQTLEHLAKTILMLWKSVGSWQQRPRH